jgi:L-rhamnose mutarotase
MIVARVAFRLRVKPGKLDEYVRIHAEVWPDLLEDMRAAGYSNYSIFADGHELFGIFETEDFEASQAALAQSDANHRWQAWMTEYLETPVDPEGKTGMNLMTEVFRME